MIPKLLEDMCNVSLSSGKKLIARFCFKVVHIKIVGQEFPVNLLVLEMGDYDVILSMDWLTRYNATIFCKKKKAVFQPSEEDAFEYKGTPQRSKWLVVTTMKASRMLAKGCVKYFANIVDTTKK